MTESLHRQMKRQMRQICRNKTGSQKNEHK